VTPQTTTLLLPPPFSGTAFFGHDKGFVWDHRAAGLRERGRLLLYHLSQEDLHYSHLPSSLDLPQQGLKEERGKIPRIRQSSITES